MDGLVSEGFGVVVLDDFSSGRENLNRHCGKLGFCLVEGEVGNSADVRKALDVVDACLRVTEKRNFYMGCLL